MRDLTKKQKTLLIKWFKESGKKQPWETKIEYSLEGVDGLTDEQYNILVDINDTEILYQNVNRFIMDLQTKELMRTGWYD